MPRLFAVVAISAGLMAAAPSYGAITAPTPTGPSDGSTQDQAPVFGWTSVTGAASYNFELATDPGFNSVVYTLTGTKNTRATDPNALQDDIYYWHVRSVNSTGTASPWSTTMQFTKSWTDTPVQESPADGSTVSFPTPLILNWDKTPYAASYHLIVATDSQLTSPVLNLGAPGSLSGSSNSPNGTQFAPSQQLPPGTYYWEVWPVDAAQHEGQGSGVWSFTWQDPDAMTNLQVTDQVSDPNLFEPLFSWDPVPGAKGYQLDINPAADFSSGSSICCGSTVYSTSYAPTTVLENNTLYWRVRPVFVDSTAGEWTEGSQFTQEFDDQDPTIPNLRMIGRDGTDIGGLSTDTPIVAWDPVAGASYYEVNIAGYSGGHCTWGSQLWNSKTASTYWTPLGNGLTAKPYPSSGSVSADSTALSPGMTYCVRVVAYSDRAAGNVSVHGTYTYLNGDDQPAFTFSTYPTGSACSPSCNSGYLGDDDSLLPVEGSTTPRTPLFTWNPIAGAASYFVIVAKDAQFTNIVDYAFTRVPAYAPRTGTAVKTYTDESTKYYWAVLPASNANGTGGPGNPLMAAFHDFIKNSVPPAQDLPVAGDTVNGAVEFQWEPTEGARKYILQVDDQNTFSSTLFSTTVGTTDATVFVANTGLPQGTLYWRVQAQDEAGVGLNWSPTESFTHTLDAPTIPTGPGINPASGPDVPAWQWNPVDGAAGYVIQVQWEKTPGTLTSQTWPTTANAWSASTMTGVGQFQWRVHAVFQGYSGTFPGNDSPWQSFNRTIPGPTGLASDLATNAAGATRVLTTWNPTLGAKSYKVQFSTTNSFSSPFDNATVQNAAYAPAMSGFSSTTYANGGTIYWRVASVDDDGNVGSYTVSTLTLPSKMTLTSSTSAVHKGVITSVTFTLKTPGGTGVVGASVHVSGAGVSASTKTTGTGGKVTFKLKPTKSGTITVTASKTGFYKTSAKLTAY
jgi:hypothetical protein